MFLFYFCQFTRLGVDDITMQIDVLWHERVGTNRIDGIPYWPRSFHGAKVRIIIKICIGNYY